MSVRPDKFLRTDQPQAFTSGEKDQAASNLGAGSIYGELLFKNVITPPQITSDQNDYSPTGLDGAQLMRLSSDAARNITGLADVFAGRIIVIENIGSFDITLKNENASSGSANRFSFGRDVPLKPSSGVLLFYDGTSSQWRAIGSVSSVSGPGSSTNGSFAQFDGTSGNLIKDGPTVIPIAQGGSGQATAAAGFDALKQAATTGYFGVVQLATQANMEAQASGVVPTPNVLKNHPGVAKAWAVVDISSPISTGPITPLASYGVASASKPVGGQATLNWTTAFSSAEYIVVATAMFTSGNIMPNILTQTAGSVTIKCVDDTGTLIQPSRLYIAVFGDQ